MKKISYLLVFVLILGLLVPSFASANDATSVFKSNDAKITPYEYTKLVQNAGLAAYVYTDFTVDLNPSETGNFTIIDKGQTYFIAEYQSSYYDVEVLINKNGLAVAYEVVSGQEPRKVPLAYENKLEIILQTAVKTFIGPTIQDMNYFSFEHMDATKLVETYARGTIKFPSDAVIRGIYGKSYSNSSEAAKYNSNLFTPGQKHVMNFRKIDDIEFTKNNTNYITVYYTGDGSAVLSDHDDDHLFSTNLENKFKPVITDVAVSNWAYEPIKWAVLNGMIQGYENGSFKPNGKLTESQFLSLISKYYKVNTSLDGVSNTYNIDGAYVFFNKYGIQLDGWKTPKKRSDAITRGKVAQLLSVTQGGPKDLNGAVQFLINNNLTTAKTVLEYKPNDTLQRAQISAFFQRMDEVGLKTLK